MSPTTLSLTDALRRYLGEVGWRDHPALRRLREETARLPDAGLQIAPEQGQFMMLLVELTAPRKLLEIGTFTGYSALCAALAMPADARLVALDLSEEWTAIARRHWRDAGVVDRIDLRLGPALDSLDRLIAEGETGSFDQVFIDADKANYENYYERALALLRPGGLIIVDNTLWDGKVADPRENDDNTRAIRAFNRRIHGDQRVTLCLVPIADGVTLARKR